MSFSILIIDGKHEQRTAFFACWNLWAHLSVPLLPFHYGEQPQHLASSQF